MSYENESLKVLYETLPWTLPLYAGKGLDELEYKHLTHIPVKGGAKLLLFDLYKKERDDRSGGFY